MTTSTHVQVRVPRSAPRRWHADLVAALRALPHTSAGISWVAGSEQPVPGLTSLVTLQRRLHGLPARGWSPVAGADLESLPTQRSGPVRRVVLDLTGAADGREHGWTLEYDGRTGESALASALLARRFPVVQVVDTTGTPLVSGRPGSESPGIAAAALDDVLAGCVQLLVAAVRGAPLFLPADPDGVPGRGRPRSAAHQAVRSTAGVGIRSAARLALRTPHWRVGWRHIDGAGTLGTMRHPTGGWTDLPDDGHHFYADPFPIVVAGRTYLFVEDFDHRVGRGVISAVEFGPAGPLGTPVPVLTHDVHLSYPCVLEDEGEIWMIPETSAAGTVELYRATAFPDRWTLHAVLLQDVDANDVTPFRHDGRWWLSASVRTGGSCSDALHLWYADHLTGPWRQHPHNPVLIDITSARPAGRVEPYGDRLLRPVQDGSAGYGSALAVAEILQLDPERYEQRVIGRLTAGAQWPGHRLHTLNRAGDLEVIDGSGTSVRLPSRRHARR